MHEAGSIKRSTRAKKFSFQSDVINMYLSPGERRELDVWCPRYVQPLLLELAEQVRGMDFYVPVGGDGSISIKMFDRATEEVCELVDWTCSIWNLRVAKEVRSRKLTVQELIRDCPMRDGWSSRKSLLHMLEGWGEGIEEWGDDYVSPAIFPFAGATDPFATPGNLCAAMGLAVLDYAMTLRSASSTDAVIEIYGAAWHFALVARSLNRQEMGHQFDAKFHSARMSRAAASRYSDDPKQAIKAQVKECWRRWQEEPSSYPSAAAFARGMLDKWPDDLTSEAVISRWVRDWKRKS